MAEIRKHKPTVTGAIDQAILAALGEDVRPIPPGAPRRAADVAQTPAASATPAAAHLTLPSGAWLSVDPTAIARTRPQHDDKDTDDDAR